MRRATPLPTGQSSWPRPTPGEHSARYTASGEGEGRSKEPAHTCPGPIAGSNRLPIIYSLGLGLPFIAAGAFGGSRSGLVSSHRRGAAILHAASGAVLIAMGVLLLTNQCSTHGSLLRFYAKAKWPPVVNDLAARTHSDRRCAPDGCNLQGPLRIANDGLDWSASPLRSGAARI